MTLPPCPASADGQHYADLALRDDGWTEVAAVCTECGYSRVFVYASERVRRDAEDGAYFRDEAVLATAEVTK